MATDNITIDGKKYELSQLPKPALQQLTNLRMAEQEISRLRVQLALAQTARNVYGQVLRTELAKKAQ